MADGQIVVVRGYREFLTACDAAGKEAKREVRETFRRVGDDVRRDSLRLFSTYGTTGKGSRTFGGSRASHAESALHYRTYVRRTGVSVESTERKTTGKHPEYGAVQMRHGLLPGREKNRDNFERGMEQALDHVADYFDNL